MWMRKLNNIADIGSKEYEHATPVLWHIPKTGGTTVQSIVARCLGLVTASGSGSILEEEEAKKAGLSYAGPEALKVILSGNKRFVNVDVATVEGIMRAEKFDPIGSGLVDVALAPDLIVFIEHL